MSEPGYSPVRKWLKACNKSGDGVANQNFDDLHPIIEVVKGWIDLSLR